MTDTTESAPVVCAACGAEIGNYFSNGDGKVRILVGQVVLRDAWGWCACGEEWTFHSSDKDLERLIEKLVGK